MRRRVFQLKKKVDALCLPETVFLSGKGCHEQGKNHDCRGRGVHSGADPLQSSAGGISGAGLLRKRRIRAGKRRHLQTGPDPAGSDAAGYGRPDGLPASQKRSGHTPDSRHHADREKRRERHRDRARTRRG